MLGKRFLALSKKWSHDLANYGDLMMGEGGREGGGETQKAGKRKDGELSSVIIERERGERGKPT